MDQGFGSWKVSQLRQFLSERGVPNSDASKRHLVELAVFAWDMKLLVVSRSGSHNR
jgi:hypothetical protein